jgi:undecaprenyl-diphosphatase
LDAQGWVVCTIGTTEAHKATPRSPLLPRKSSSITLREYKSSHGVNLETALISIDNDIVVLLNQFAHRWWTLDSFIMLVGFNPLIKGGVITSLIWWAWFRPGANKSRDRELLIYGIIACLLALLVSRTLAHELPFRERPLRNPALHFQLPYHADEASLMGWSSFPSDHAALFFALATSIFFVSRAAGILTLFHAFFVICLPRIYFGIHYPTDILAGALIGVAIASSAKIVTLRSPATRIAMRWLERYPGGFYASLFLLTFLLTVTFDPIRRIGMAFFDLLKIILNCLR